VGVSFTEVDVLTEFSTRLMVRFGGSERYWKARRRIRRVYFAVAGRLFAARYATSEAFTSASALRYLLRNAAVPVLLACGLIALFAVLQTSADDLASDLGLGKLDTNAYNSLLEAIAGVTGVFLALYFTAVSAVAATVYAAVPHDVRSLIVRDRLGNVYVIGVAFTMALAILLLLTHAAAGSAYRLALPVIGVLSLFSIFAFIRLGQRAFYMADPTRLADTLTYDFNSWLKRAKYGGWRWDVPAFQNHYRRQARRSASSLASLFKIASAESHLRGESLRLLIRKTTRLLAYYLGSRYEIPTRSQWFGERYEHQQWYLAGSTEIEMATATATSLNPKVVPDATWVEDDLLGPLIDSALADLTAGEFEQAFLSMESFPGLWQQFGGAWSSKEGLRWAEKVADGILSAVVSEALKEQERAPQLAGIVDVAAMLPMSVELGFHGVVVETDIPNLGSRIAQSDWSDTATPYRFRLSSKVLRALEDAQAGVEFENLAAAPKETRTPGWYVEEVALHAFEQDLKEQIDMLVRFLGDWYPNAADRLTAANKFDAAAAVLTRGLEVVWKLERHIEEWKQTVEAIRGEGERVDFKRPEWDWDSYRQSVRNLRISVLERLARSIPLLGLQERREDLPDFFGHAVHQTGEACFEALSENDSELFAKLFPTYFIGTLLVAERVRGQVSDMFPEQALTWMFQPILDALDLSGYALLYSELHGNPAPWNLCKAEWQKYLSEDGEERLKRIAALSAFQQGQLAMAPRALMRTRWQMTFSRALEELPRDDETTEHPFGQRPVRHESALIRRIAPDEGMLGGMLLHQASDAFIVKFLAKQEGAQGLDFGVADWVARELDEVDDEGNGGDGIG
jgi:hypothetical protein